MLKPEEVTQAIKKEIQKYETKLEMQSVGYVLQVGDGIARVYGLDEVMAGELVTFHDGTTGLVLNLEPNHVGVVILGDFLAINEGDEVRVKVLGIDDRGKVRLSMKVVDQATGEDLTGKQAEAAGE